MSGRRKSGELSVEDRILWSRVAHSVNPLNGRLIPPVPEQSETGDIHKNGAASLIKPVAHPPYQPNSTKPRSKGAPANMDLPTRRKLSKGRLSIDATIDLHDLHQAEAHGILLAFLHRAHAAGLRHVLVITGKGASFGSAGVLRRVVPVWLKTEPFSGLVGGYDNAARHHGGAGAIYVRLKRRGF